VIEKQLSKIINDISINLFLILIYEEYSKKLKINKNNDEAGIFG